jgi:hypothetical protein
MTRIRWRWGQALNVFDLVGAPPPAVFQCGKIRFFVLAFSLFSLLCHAPEAIENQIEFGAFLQIDFLTDASAYRSAFAIPFGLAGPIENSLSRLWHAAEKAKIRP